MSITTRRRIATIVVPGLLAGGACGAGVGLDLYPAWVGVGGAALAGAVVCVLLLRQRNAR